MALQTTPPKATIEKIDLVKIVESINIDGSFCGKWGREGDRYLVEINNNEIPLTGKSFGYFTKLAWHRKMVPAGWIWKEDIEPGWNQARYLYRMKGEIAEVIGNSWPVVENNRLGYYRLNADSRVISFDVENLRKYPDISISKFFDGTLA